MTEDSGTVAARGLLEHCLVPTQFIHGHRADAAILPRPWNPPSAMCNGVRPSSVLGIDIGLIGQQQFRHVLAAIPRRLVQRRLAGVVLGIDIGLVGQQQFRHVLVATNTPPSAKASSRSCPWR